MYHLNWVETSNQFHSSLTSELVSERWTFEGIGNVKNHASSQHTPSQKPIIITVLHSEAWGWLREPAVGEGLGLSDSTVQGTSYGCWSRPIIGGETRKPRWGPLCSWEEWGSLLIILITLRVCIYAYHIDTNAFGNENGKWEIWSETNSCTASLAS